MLNNAESQLYMYLFYFPSLVCVVVLYCVLFLLLSFTLRDATSIWFEFMLRSNKVLDGDDHDGDDDNDGDR